MALLTDKGWNKLSNQEEVKEVEVRALFNMIDKDGSGELSLEEARKACKLIQARFNISEVNKNSIAIAGPGPCPVQVHSKSVRESLRISENNKDLDQGIAPFLTFPPG